MIALGLAAALFAGGPSIYVMHGSCFQLSVAGADQLSRCDDKLVVSAPDAQHTVLMIGWGESSMVGFYGTIRSRDHSRYTLSIDEVALLENGAKEVRRIPATGSCIYSSTHAVHEYVVCEASAEGQAYAFSFASEGKPPPLPRP